MARNRSQRPSAWNELSLRIFSEVLDPEAITSCLGMQPDAQAVKGSHYKGNPRHGIHKAHYWCLRITRDDTVPYPEQMREFLDGLGRKKSRLRSLTRKKGVSADLYLGYAPSTGMGSLGTLSADLLAAMGDLGLSLTLDVYAPRNEKE